MGGTQKNRRSSGHAAITTYGASVLVAALSLINVLVIARVLGPAGRGQVVFLMAVAGLTGYAFTLSVQEANANLAGQEPETRPALATNSVILALVLGFFAASLIYGVRVVAPSLMSDVDTGLLWIAIAAIPLIILQNYLMLLARGDFAATAANVALIVPPITNVAVNALLAATGVLSVTTVIATWTISQALSCATLVWYVARRLAGFGKPDAPLSRRSLSFGLKSHGGGMMSAGNLRLDQWILGSVAGPRELGFYSVAVAWADALFFLPTALALAYRPDLVRAPAPEARAKAAAVTRFALLATIPVAVALLLAAPFLCVTLMGQQFGASVQQLRLLVPGAFGIVALKILGNVLVAQGRPLLETAGIGVAFAFTVVLDIVLIPPFGGIGASVASSIAYTVAGVVTAMIFLKALHGRPRELMIGREDVADAYARLKQISSTLRPAKL